MKMPFLLLFLIFLLSSCGPKSTNMTEVQLVGQFSRAGIQEDLPVGATEKFQAIGIFDDNHWEDQSKKVTWSVNTICPTDSDPGSPGTTVAQIDEAGTVTAIAGGTVFVVATLDSFIACFSITVSGSALVSIDVTPTNPSIAAGTTQQFIATGTYADASVRDITNSVAWTTDSSVIATIKNTGSRGLATGKSAGVTTVTATAGSIFGSTTLTVTPATLVALEVTPRDHSIGLGATKQFAATGIYSDDTTQDLTNTVVWTSSTGAVATINAAGLASSVGLGTTTVTAATGGLSDDTSLTVIAAYLESIAVTPANSSLPLGLTRQFTATGTYTDGSTADLTAVVVWTSTNTSKATITNGGLTPGLASSVALGVSTIRAASGSVVGSTDLTIVDAALASILVTPAAPSIVKATTQQFTATGTYTDGSTLDITTSVVWTTGDAAIATVSNAAGSQGRATGTGVGVVAITATSGAVSDSENLTVTPALLESITVTPSTTTINRGGTRQFTATGHYSDGTSVDITTSVTWKSSTNATATISNAAGTQGLATGVSLGFVTITATSSGINGTASATVLP